MNPIDFGGQRSKVIVTRDILYTALNSPSLLFVLKSFETDSPNLEFAHAPILLYNHLYIIQLAQAPKVRGRKGRK